MHAQCMILSSLFLSYPGTVMGCGASSGGGVPDVDVTKSTTDSNRFDSKRGLTDSSTEPALLSMHMLFAFYDADASGSIDAKELLKMMTNVLRNTKGKKKKKKKKSNDASGPWSKWEDDRLSEALAQEVVMLHAGLRRADARHRGRIDGRDLQNEEQVAAEPHHLVPVARLDRGLFLVGQAVAGEIGVFVGLEGLAVLGLAEIHRHLVELVALQGTSPVE